MNGIDIRNIDIKIWIYFSPVINLFLHHSLLFPNKWFISDESVVCSVIIFLMEEYIFN